VPFPSVHPRDPEALDRLARIADEGFAGVKLHPYYQDFLLDEDIMWPFYGRMAERNLILTAHTGFDVAFERIRRCDPARIARVLATVPELTMIATHMGSWMDWDEVREHLVGKPVYMETSYSLECMPPDRARAILTAHPPEYLLFGSDSPWQDQSATLGRLRALGLGASLEQAILEDNPARLLAG
jgi:uncharacterized protein